MFLEVIISDSSSGREDCFAQLVFLEKQALGKSWRRQTGCGVGCCWPWGAGVGEAGRVRAGAPVQPLLELGLKILAPFQRPRKEAAGREELVEVSVASCLRNTPHPVQPGFPSGS